jgi:hypothetical protein
VRDNLAAVLETVYWGLAISATILAIWTGRRMRHRWDLARMRRQPKPRQAASEQAVLDYLTIRVTWNQPTREEAGR